jgi:CHASE3 domain sensor protein
VKIRSSRLRNSSSEEILAALIAVPAAVLVGIETYHATTILPELARSRAAVAHTLQVIDATRTLDEAIQDAQRGERGFIITGNVEYLEPYTNAIKDAPARLAELKVLTEPSNNAASISLKSRSILSCPN